MGDVTQLLTRAVGGDRQAQEDLYCLTEPELRKLALHWIRRKSAGNSVRTTEVIDRAFLKLMRIAAPDWEHRGAYYQFASRNILCVLIDLLRSLSRRLTSLPDGGDLDGLAARSPQLALPTLLTLRQALEDLERDLSERHRAIVELRFLGECTLDDVAQLLSIDRYKVFRLSNVALAYLREKLGPSFPDLGQSPNQASGE